MKSLSWRLVMSYQKYPNKNDNNVSKKEDKIMIKFFIINSKNKNDKNKLIKSSPILLEWRRKIRA